MTRALRPRHRIATLAVAALLAVFGLTDEAFAEGPEARPFVGSSLDQDDVLKHIRAAAITSLRPVGTTSVVFAATLKTGVNAAFKPRQQAKPLGYRSEIAAYRVARLLGLDNVPPSVTRMVPVAVLREKLAPEFRAAEEEFVRALVTEKQGGADVVPGVATYWVPDLRDLGLDSPRRMERWTRHLKQSGVIREEERSWHRDLSNVLLFDYLIANGDRWSGSNLQGVRDGSRVIIRDHDLAFPENLKQEKHAELFAHLMRTEKFSRSVVTNLRAMTEGALRAELGRDPRAATEALLADVQVAGVLERRSAILSYVGALIEQYGEDRVLVFE